DRHRPGGSHSDPEDASDLLAAARRGSGTRRPARSRPARRRDAARRCRAGSWCRETGPACKIQFYMPTASGSSTSPGGPSGGSTVTPAMRQYLDAKQQYRDAILFFRMGDFYEMFYEDAL